MNNQALNTLTNMVLAATLLTVSFSALTQACGSKTEVANPAKPTYDGKSDTVRIIPGSRDHAVIRFRRGLVVEEEEDEGITTPSSISNIEVFQQLDLDFDDKVSVIEWSLEGGSVSDFWALLTRHDIDGDELISIDEFAPVHVRTHV